MPGSPLGRTLVIANPAAHSGRGEDGARFAQEFLQSYASATRGFEVVRTQGPADATRIARGVRGFDTILALGGDGVIHEVVCGLALCHVGPAHPLQRPRGLPGPCLL